jgi:hypothetical protein
MRTKNRKKILSEEEIDRVVSARADDAAAWTKPIRVQKAQASSVSLPTELTARAAFFARLHREASVQDWLKRIIQERIDLEEAAFVGLKRDLSTKSNNLSHRV